MPTASIFVSGVQKELAEARRAIKTFVESDPLLRRFFTVFLFEDLPARDRRADTVYLDQVDHCAVYVGLFGSQYGFEDPGGVSPTEREFDRATARGKPRLIFVKGADDNSRHPKMASLVRKAESQLMRRRFGSVEQLRDSLYSSLVEFLEERGLIQNRPFEERPSVDASLADINADALTDFVRRARHERQFPLPVETPVADVLTHLHLLRDGRPTHAAVLLFGRDPQRFVPASELRCMHFHGAEIQRPVPFYRSFKGNLFEQVDRGADFVLSVLNRTVGTRDESAQAPVAYEIPPDVVREAIVNAIAHRDYSSAAAVQVSVFADRVEILNPGDLPPPLTPERLREPHGSIARNHRICEALFQARYIEKYGTGTLMMIRLCQEHGLAEPRFEQRGGEFVVTLGRDWLTVDVLKQLNLNDRQRRAVLEVKLRGRIGNLAYQRLTGAIKKTASRDLEDLVAKEVFSKAGTTGRGTHYVLAPKGDIKGTSAEPPEQKPKRRKGDSKGPKGTFSRPKPGRPKGDVKGT